MSNNTTGLNQVGPNAPDFYYIILAVLGSLGVLFNGVLLIVLWRNKTPEFRLGTSYVIGNLALSDCLTGESTFLYCFYRKNCFIIIIACPRYCLLFSDENLLINLRLYGCVC
jgi:hypothetical protein